MKHIVITLFVAMIGLGMMVQNAEAKRFGGGMSSGIRRDSSVMQRQAIPPRPTTPSQAAAPAPAGAAVAPAPASGMSRWMGPLAGLAAGIGLATLFSRMGMGGGLGNMLPLIALALAAVFLVRWMMSKRQNTTTMQYAGAGNVIPPAAYDTPTTGVSNAPLVIAGEQMPAGFDADGFLRQAKLNFMRLQAANDRGDMDDIRQFTSPEMFAEVQLEYQERGRQIQQTDVIDLNAYLLDVTDEAGRQLVSVRFKGQIREQAGAVAEAFSEVWHLSKPNDGSHGWTVVGIQQD